MFLNSTTDTLTRREAEVMSILWEAEQPLIASEIANRGDHLTINTVQAVLKKLLNRKLIVIDKIVYSGTVLTRSYSPAISADEFEMGHLLSAFQKLSHKASVTSNFVATFLEQETDRQKLLTEIEQLENLLAEKRKQIETEDHESRE